MWSQLYHLIGFFGSRLVFLDRARAAGADGALLNFCHSSNPGFFTIFFKTPKFMITYSNEYWVYQNFLLGHASLLFFGSNAVFGWSWATFLACWNTPAKSSVTFLHSAKKLHSALSYGYRTLITRKENAISSSESLHESINFFLSWLE
jgi:hypothetical protein